MKKTIRLENIFLGWRKNKSLFLGAKPVYLFTKRPILHQDFTSKFLQDAIHELQEILQDKNLLSNSSGKLDSETVEAVKEFQRQNNLHIDGIVGPLTWACLCYPKLSISIRNHEPKLQDLSST